MIQQHPVFFVVALSFFLTKNNVKQWEEHSKNLIVCSAFIL
jgi:hypothetical protein